MRPVPSTGFHWFAWVFSKCHKTPFSEMTRQDISHLFFYCILSIPCYIPCKIEYPVIDWNSTSSDGCAFVMTRLCDCEREICLEMVGLLPVRDYPKLRHGTGF